MKKFCAVFLALCLAALGLCPVSLAFEGAIYEIFPGSFADSNGDGKGDLMGIAQKADYIASLGVGAVWLTPFYPTVSYHGYDVMDYCDVRPSMGGMEAFDEMLKTLHEKNIAVIIDLVLNHSSHYHPWFTDACTALALGKESPYLDYYIFSRESGPNMHAVPGASGWYYLGEFGHHMPDLNLDNAKLRLEIEGILRFWLEKGVDGFRLDATTHYYGGHVENNTAFLAWLMETARAIREDVYIVGEAWTDDGTIAKMYESGISSLFHFSLADSNGAILDAVRTQNGSKLARKIAVPFEMGMNAPFLTNHDMGRSAGMLMQNIEKMRVAAAAYLLSPGHPVIYYGEEIGMTGSGRDENKRLAMVWGEDAYACQSPEEADQQQKLQAGVLQQESDEASLLNTYRAIVALRNAHPEIDTESPEALDLGVKALYAIRYGQTHVLINMGKKEISLEWQDAARLEQIGGVTLENSLLIMGPWSIAVLSNPSASQP